MPIPTFKFNNLTRTDLLQFDGVNFVNVPVYAVGKNVMWGPEEFGYSSLLVGDITKNISLVGHKHTTNDILGLKEFINDLGVNSNSGTDLSKYLLISTFIDHLNNINSAKHVTQAHLDKLNSLNNYWQLDEQGNLYTTYNAYSTKGVSALGLGSGGGGGGGDIDMLDSWVNYTPAKSNFYVPASLLVPFRDDTLSRLTSLESGGGTEYILPTASATTLGGIKVGQRLSINNGVLSADVQSNNYSLPTASATTLGGIKVGDGLTIYNGILSVLGGGGGGGSVTSVGLSVPTGLSVTGSPITSSGTLAISFAYGYSIPTTNNQSNWNSAYNHSQSAHNYLPLSGGALTGNLTAPTINASTSVSTPKINFGNNWTLEASGTELVFKHNGVIKQRMLSNGTILATGGITALST